MGNKITYENIHHALKCCWMQGMCGECPYNDSDYDIAKCTSDLARETMILLESLKNDNDRLPKSLNLTQQEQYTNGRNDGIREFAEKLNERKSFVMETEYDAYVVDLKDVDELVKEMTEGRRMSITTSIRIVFYDRKPMVIDGVTDYGFMKECDLYYVEKNGFRMYFDKKMIRCFGRDFDLPAKKEDTK